MSAVADRVRAGGLGRPGSFAAILLAGPALLGIARLLPAAGPGLALRLAAATICVLLLPGAVILRALGWPVSIGLVLAGSLVWSLVAIFVALALTFVANGSLLLTLVVVAASAAFALVPALRAEPARFERSDALSALAILVAGIGFAAAVWWAQVAIDSDWPFHLARIRKLAELPSLSSTHTVSEFATGGLHPGYAFPLWHAALALVTRLAGVDSAVTLEHMSAVLTPLALLLAYAAGRELFRSWGAGIATAAAQAAVIGFASANSSSFRILALPLSAAPLLLVPALLALTFALVHGAPLRTLATIAATGFVLAVVHPTYALFVAVPLAGFLVVRALVTRSIGEPRRIAAALGALLVPTAFFFVWLLPFARDAIAQTPSAAQRAGELRRYVARLDFFAGSFSVSPHIIVRAGAAAVGGLLAVPLAVFAGRRLWAAFVVGGTLAVLGLLLVPGVFEVFADAVSLTQALRLKYFLPLAFALAGAATLLARWRFAGACVALGAGVLLELVYPDNGPTWAVVLAVVGTLAALAVAAIRPTDAAPGTALWTAAAAVAFVLPIATGNLADLHPDPPDPRALTRGLVQALREDVPRQAVVYADLPTSYRIAAYAPVYIAAAPVGHIGQTRTNDPFGRRLDNTRFFAPKTSETDRQAILAKYDAGWLVVDRKRVETLGALIRNLELVFADARFALYRVPQR
jgi:hypothetical protein